MNDIQFLPRLLPVVDHCLLTGLPWLGLLLLLTLREVVDHCVLEWFSCPLLSR